MKTEEEFEGDKATIEFLNAQKPSTKATYRKGWKVQAILPSGRIVVDNEY